mmetsp:Transcript_19527/g.27831  ORF Transcript_19527/g.27831 Transcript_19527/m.27831 type:complete len:666 (-) Transcript_19527:2391-4388(-)
MSTAEEEVSPAAFPSRKRRKAKGFQVTKHGLFSVALLLILGVVSLLLDYKVTTLQALLDEEKKNVVKLEGVVADHSSVIARFNSSITNQDVVDQVNTIQNELKVTSETLTKRLDDQSKEIADKLAGTLEQLQKAVQQAEADISAEVEVVKGDVANYVRTTQDQFSMENSFMIYQLAGTITLIGCLISMWHMTSHLRKFNHPTVQRKILAILWMCPIYSATSWFSLVFDSFAEYLGIFKDFYESYVIYMFLAFLIAVLGKGDRQIAVDTLAVHSSHLKPPMGLFCCPKTYSTDRQKADAVLLQCQVFAMQFVLFKPLTSITRFILKTNGVAEGLPHFDYHSPYFYIMVVENLSVFFAFSGLVKFFHAAQEDLAWCRPWPKFLCIKGVVFMTFWQGLAISILASLNEAEANQSIKDTMGEAWAAKTQSFLICLEMLLFSIAHFYAFPVDEWQDGYRRIENTSKFGDTVAMRDFLQDLKLVLGSQQSTRDALKKAISEADAGSKPKGYQSFDETLPIPIGDGSAASGEDVRSTADTSDSLDTSILNDVENLSDLTDLRRALAISLFSPDMQDATAHLLQASFLKNIRDADEKQVRDSTVGVDSISRHVNSEDIEEPGESTSLLGSSSKRSSTNAKNTGVEAEKPTKIPNEEMLRPSIFTKILPVTEDN